MIDELAQIRVQRRDAALFVVLSVLRWIEICGHRLAERGQVGRVLLIGRAVCRRAHRRKQPPEAAFEEWRGLGGHQAPNGRAMSPAHGQLLSRSIVVQRATSCQACFRATNSANGNDVWHGILARDRRLARQSPATPFSIWQKRTRSNTTPSWIKSTPFSRRFRMARYAALCRSYSPGATV